MTYKNLKHARILQFLETLIVSHTYSLFEADLSNEKVTKKDFRSTLAEIAFHNSMNKSTRISEPTKNSQKRLIQNLTTCRASSSKHPLPTRRMAGRF